ncbi:VanZ family protein [Agrococcus sp. Marseille-P2731]|uniref:VanZ family protein n=1 Tax=Agrococcus sp. Marseille-P2731 TaxID=1841862 RepID=UPI000930E6E2|nr:VanZ family protein [Agrococcus sp. Marseille-P2731]
MLSTHLAAHPWLAGVLLAAVVTIGLPAAWWLAQRPRLTWALAAVTAVATLLLTLLPSPRELEIGCAIEWDVSLTAPEPLANIVLLVPFALLVGVAIGRPAAGAALGFAAGALLSALVEAVQALVPAIGRSCSTGDLLANAIGAAIGGLLALVALHLSRISRRRAAVRDGRARGAAGD